MHNYKVLAIAILEDAIWSILSPPSRKEQRDIDRDREWLYCKYRNTEEGCLPYLPADFCCEVAEIDWDDLIGMFGQVQVQPEELSRYVADLVSRGKTISTALILKMFKYPLSTISDLFEVPEKIMQGILKEAGYPGYNIPRSSRKQQLIAV